MIEHRYRPSVGASVQTELGSPAATKEPWYEEYKQKYCFDREFLAALARARPPGRSQAGARYSEQRIDYVLRTGANWSGPIKEFRLVIDKGDPDNLVSFCGPMRISKPSSAALFAFLLSLEAATVTKNNPEVQRPFLDRV